MPSNSSFNNNNNQEGQTPAGTCEMCGVNRAVGTITYKNEKVAACIVCIDNRSPVRRKPKGEGSYAHGGGGATNPYIKSSGAVDDGTSP